MKRKLLALFIVSGCLIGSMFAQNEESMAVGTAIGGTAKGVSRFSFGIKGGVNYLRVSDQNFQPEFGGFAEISVNPLWGFGLEYMYLINNRDATAHSGGRDLESTLQDVTLYGSLNVSNVIAKYRSHGWQKWNLYANAGGGISIYDWKLKNTDEKDNGIRPVGVAGLALEFNAAKWLALGLDGQYRFHTNGKFIGDNGGRSLIGANLSARFKFGGDKNVRNMALVNYEPQVKVTQRTNVYRRQIARLTVQVDDQKAVIEELQAQIKDIRDSLNLIDSLCAATPPVRYSPSAQKDNEKIFLRIEFETGKDVIKQSFRSSLDKLAALVKQNPDWDVVLKGHADNTGTAERNLQLSKNRANAVKDYLVKRGVRASSIQVYGLGAEKPIASNETPVGRAQNRRVEIEIVTK